MKTTLLSLGAIVIATSMVCAENERDGDRKEHKKRPSPAEMFKHMDKDGNGSISLDEFKGTKRGQKNPERAAKFFGKADRDGDGQLSMGELQAMREHMKKHGKGDKKGDRPDRPERPDAAPNGVVE